MKYVGQKSKWKFSNLINEKNKIAMNEGRKRERERKKKEENDNYA